MKDDAVRTYLVALASSLTIGVIIPLLILGLMVLGAWVMLARANRDPDFNIADVFKGDTGKVSSERTILIATWGASTWALAVVLFAHPSLIEVVFGVYMGAWAVNNAAKYVAARKYEAATPPANTVSVTETTTKVATSSEVAP